MGTSLVPVKTGIVAKVNSSPSVTMDETGWRVEAFSSWLWVATTEDATAYNVADGRGFDQACDLVDADYDGVIIRDGWGPYRSYESATHQSCTAHVRRRAAEMISDLPDWTRGPPPSQRPPPRRPRRPRRRPPPSGPQQPRTSSR